MNRFRHLPDDHSHSIDLRTPLSLRTSFLFPLQSSISKREVLYGALWLLVPVVGWLMNMGHRIVFVHNMMHGRPAWPAWRQHFTLLRHGFITFLGMLYYYTPATMLMAVGLYFELLAFSILGVLAFLAATIAIPGFMSHYCRGFDPREIFNPLRALARCMQGGRAYWHAWSIAISALGLSFFGLLLLGVGFLVTSVWFWQVAGFSFASVFAQRFSLDGESSPSSELDA